MIVEDKNPKWSEYLSYRLKALMEDESALVRKECLKYLELDSLQWLALKTQDLDESVRLETYRRLIEIWTDNVQINPDEDMIRLIVNGLEDPCEDVAKVAVQFIEEWIVGEGSAWNQDKVERIMEKTKIREAYLHSRYPLALFLVVREIIIPRFKEQEIKKYLGENMIEE